jgi:D-glycero-D-manno-heptose 1,7-bisphosphate phosphatase
MIRQVFRSISGPINGLVLADRDGTLIQDQGYFHNHENVQFLDYDIKIFQRIHQLNFALVIITNQSGIGRGYYSLDEALKVHEVLANKIESCGGLLHGAILCPHIPEDYCLCRKPNPLMLESAIKQTKLTLNRVAFFGNTYTDELAAQNSRIRYFSVNESGFANKVNEWLREDFVNLDNA